MKPVPLADAGTARVREQDTADIAETFLLHTERAEYEGLNRV